MMNRNDHIKRIVSDPSFDLVVIGGGASGIGTALEAASRGYRILLLEMNDFTQGTSSKSTKLIHGGVRYLAKGDIALVREALRERGYLVRNAPHLVHDQPFIIPVYRWWDAVIYTLGLTFYDLLAGRLSLGRSVYLSRRRVLDQMPGITGKGLRGGILYHDGQFDDSRLAMDLLHRFHEEGGIALNYCPVTGLVKDDTGRISGVQCRDRCGEQSMQIDARGVINATGVWVDEILRMDEPDHRGMVTPSQGIHLVLPRDFLPGKHALMIPKTIDGRVLFAVPWYDRLVVGTTDTELERMEEEPVPLEEEIRFILETAGKYLVRVPGREDVLSVFAGLRPLAAPVKEGARSREISRSHKVWVSGSGLVTLTGGKWTTYRKMGEDTVSRVVKVTGLPARASVTRNMHLSESNGDADIDARYRRYGKNSREVAGLEVPGRDPGERLVPGLPYTSREIRWICRNEMVCHLDDMMARRLRALFLDVRASRAMAGEVATIMQQELNWTEHRKKEELNRMEEVAKRFELIDL